MALADNEKLFYAMQSEAAELYDSTIELVAPEYDLLHRAMMQVMVFHLTSTVEAPSLNAEIHLDPTALPTYSAPHGWILDIGSGIGAESSGLLTRFPNMNVVALDIAEPMHAKMQEAFNLKFPGQAFPDRVRPVTADLLEYCGSSKPLRSLHPDWDTQNAAFDAIISTFTIHHFTADIKLTVYQSIFDALKPGGIFINADLFTFTSETFANWAKVFDESWIVQQFDNPDPKRFPKSAGIDTDRRQYLKDMWMNHYKEFNILGPVEDPHPFEQHASDIIGQRRMLHQAGFCQVGMPFRYWQMGVLCGVKQRD